MQLVSVENLCIDKEDNWAEACPMDETSFDRTYVPEHLAGKVRNWRKLSASDRLDLTDELSKAAWTAIGFGYDPSKPMDKTIRPVDHARKT